MPHSSVLQGLAIAKPSAESGVPPSSEAAKPALAAPSSAAAAFLTSIGGRFSSGGTIQPELEGMQKAPEALEPPAQVQQHHLVYHWDAFTHRVARQTFTGSGWHALHYCKGAYSHIVAANCRRSHSKMRSKDYRDSLICPAAVPWDPSFPDIVLDMLSRLGPSSGLSAPARSGGPSRCCASASTCRTPSRGRQRQPRPPRSSRATRWRCQTLPRQLLPATCRALRPWKLHCSCLDLHQYPRHALKRLLEQSLP